MRVAVLDDYTDSLRSLPCFSLLDGHDVTVHTDHAQGDDLVARLEGVEAVCLFRERTALDAPLLDQLAALRLVSLRSAYPHVDVDACTRHGITVCSNLHADAPSYAAAELTWGLVLAASRRIPSQATSLREGRWQTELGRTLRGATLGVLGYGRIGAAVASYGRAFGMHVLAFGGEGSAARAARDGVEVSPSQAALFERSDVLTVHVRLVEQTKGLVGRDDLERMRPDALFVNTSRAGLVEPGALADALRAGRPGHAALDVFDHEPMFDEIDELATLGNVVATPHLGFCTTEELELQFADVFGQVAAYASGQPRNVVNPEVVRAATRRREGP
jgi:D-3-phosphoglycerate dehydrogenase